MSIQLVSFPLCPYVQRAVIALQEKGVTYAINYIDLDDPPAWFKQRSPLSKVPLLFIDQETLFESSVILDYLDEVYPPRLHPVDALQRARHKAWIAYGSELLAQQHLLALAKDRAEFEARLDELKIMMQRLTEPLASGLFGGAERFFLTDAAYAPLFMRLSIQGELCPEVTACYPSDVAHWADALLARPSVQESVVPDFTTRYLRFLRERDSWLASQAE